ncbi:helix-turn-helix domain-containing protein [Kribbella italica]|uniref:Transcriptional regulator with XRE-family HTH domain n=1 Tax=Kribbella italica TaxID=1540520 RepID=A0A7W9JCN3_9ACTN|nr:transcriptional regulator with XRE-family HTH domain [Kribbella italica]
MDLGAELRDRRKTAGRTIASVAVDAGLSVPYIANLENGRGNPTVATLTRLAEALGTTLRVDLDDQPSVDPDNLSPRAVQVIDQLAATQRRTKQAVRRDLHTTLEGLKDLLGREPTTRDIDRLLDLTLLGS